MHPDLKVHPKARVIHKGINPEVDSYSAFFDNAKMGKTSLEEIIKDEEVVDLYICGIATDVCVGELSQSNAEDNAAFCLLQPPLHFTQMSSGSGQS